MGPCERVRRRCGGGYYAGLGRPRPRCSGLLREQLWLGGMLLRRLVRRRGTQVVHPVWQQGVGTAPPARRHAKNKTAAPRAASAHIVVVHLGVSAYAHGPPRKPPRMLRTGGHRWRSRGGDAPPGYHLTLILLLCWPPHLARGHALAGCFSPATSCLAGRVLPRAPLPGGLPFLA